MEDGNLLLGIDLQSVDIDTLLGPLYKKGQKARFVESKPAPIVDDVISSQRQAIQKPPPPSSGPRQAKALNSLAHGPALGGGRCGERMQFVVTTVAEDGEVLKEGGARITTTVTGLDLLSKTHPEPRPWVEDQQDGTYTVQFVCATPGLYEIMACVDGVPLPMCPMKIDVRPGLPCATRTEVAGKGALQCELGGMAEFTIQAKDEFSNLCGEGGARFGVRACAHARLHEVADNEDGTYTVCYSIPEYAQGPVRLEVLLDGVPIKGSPLIPQITGAPPKMKSEAAKAVGGKSSEKTLADHMASLRWLRENTPAAIPEIPAAALSAALSGGDTGNTDSATRAAWRTADEWRRLSEVRNTLTSSRECLAEHQGILLSVGDAILHELERMEDRERALKAKELELSDVEQRLEGMRAEMSREYASRQRLLQTMAPTDAVLDAGRMPSFPSTGPSTGRAGKAGSRPTPAELSLADSLEPLSPGVRTLSPDSSSGGAVYRKRVEREKSNSGYDEASATQQLAALHRGIEEKKRQLRIFEEAASSIPNTAQASSRHPILEGQGFASLKPPSPPPSLLNAPAPPPARRDDSDLPARARDKYYGINQPLPPPSPPPKWDQTVSSLDLSPIGTGGTIGASELLRTPPGPPAPPPAMTTYGGYRSSAPTSQTKQAYAGGASIEELSQASKQLFHTFASRAAGSVAVPQGGRSGRVGLGLQDFLRLSNAAQFRLSKNELEAIFMETNERFGGSASNLDSANPILAYESFYELLVIAAKRRYPDLDDAEGTAALFEEHLLPLSRRLRQIETGAANATN
eukprot:TRINITY_DN20616_c3_g1_i1.p1 TRINITY_DN20616_c3_g1~~TRINITY_DN20616_c3_g1_i1.p1  ORF type:complete len:804 (+),score=170.17 TRINITY_DN20616_c3_g1_i1:62-2473(+)